jgi:hypothetical protein
MNVFVEENYRKEFIMGANLPGGIHNGGSIPANSVQVEKEKLSLKELKNSAEKGKEQTQAEIDEKIRNYFKADSITEKQMKGLIIEQKQEMLTTHVERL